MIVSCSLGNQVVNVDIVGLSDAVNSVLRLNKNLQRNKKNILEECKTHQV